jgi:hypothetical protein
MRYGIATFDTPKPTRLIQRILEICPDKEALREVYA